MLIADLEGTTLVDIAIRNTPVTLSMSDRRYAMALVRELQALGFIELITPYKGASHGPSNDGTGVALSA